MWQLVVTYILPVLVTIAIPTVLLLVHKLMTALAKKFNMQWLLDYEARVDALVEQGIQAVENKALAATKLGTLTSSEQKLQSVITFVNAELTQYGLPQKAADSLAKLVDAKLFNGVDQAPVATPVATVAPASK